MPVEFKDYYATLGVAKTATQEEIKRAFRDLARKCHPDVAKPGTKSVSEARFKEINEAYEVLKDPEKRRKYDRLGSDWDKYDDEAFSRAQARTGTGGFRTGAGGEGGFEYHFGGTGFSDFFEQFFGGVGRDPFSGFHADFGQARRRSGRQASRGQDVEADFLVTLEEASCGVNRRISFSKRDPSTGIEKAHTIDVKVPAGIREGQRIRLAGQGQPGCDGGEAGDLFLRIRFAQHPDFSVKDGDLYYTLKLAPWDAALGCTVDVPTLRGKARVTVKAGASSGRKLRLPGYGLPKPGGGHGDLLAEVLIEVPELLSVEQRRLWEELRAASK